VNIELLQPKFKAPSGAERFILSLGRALAERGCRVRVVCHQFDPRCRPLAQGLSVDETGLRLDWSGNHYLDSISSYLACFRLRTRLARDADVVCLFGPALPLAAIGVRAGRLTHFCYEPPRAVGVDKADVLARVGRLHWLLNPALGAYRAVDRWLIRRVEAIFVSGPYAQELVRAEYGLASHVVTPGVSFERPPIARTEARASLGIADTERLAISVNFLHPRKRVDLLLHAWARVEPLLSRARLLIVGEGPERAGLERLVARLGLHRVRFAGYVAEGELANLYAAADLLVHVARQETFGLTVVEAAAFAVPSVVADEGGPRYTVVDGETGLRVPAEQKAIADAMARLLGDRELSLRMGEAARARVAARYTWQQGAAEFLEVCRRLGVNVS
jgi:glycosyltransferase involved in cell wall biosynthesis